MLPSCIINSREQLQLLLLPLLVHPGAGHQIPPPM